MTVREAAPEELDAIMAIYRSAQEFMIRSGNPTQWGRFNPTREMIEADITAGRCRVLTEDGTVHGVFALCPGEEPNYRVIENGAWPNDAPYVAIHRVASDGALRGVFRAFSDLAKSLSPDVRVDTHRDNRIMQEKIGEEGFVRCGTVFAEDGTPRIAYQWIDKAGASDSDAESSFFAP